jgi:hypothetical protein
MGVMFSKGIELIFQSITPTHSGGIPYKIFKHEEGGDISPGVFNSPFLIKKK